VSVYCNCIFEATALAEGDWHHGLKHGHGIESSPDGYHYDGQWVAGKKQGPGTQKKPNGDVYIGEFAQDEWHGDGQLTFGDGRPCQQGLFLHGAFQTSYDATKKPASCCTLS
jgi:hypothetical protein